MAIDLAFHNHIAIITINHQDKLNALNGERLQSLSLRLEEASLNPDCRVIVLTGAGDRAFVAGADISAMASMTQAEASVFAELGHAVARSIEQAPQPVIAAINGFALGGGCELALACDIRIAAANAVFAQPEVALGIPPGWGGTQRLPRVIGPGMASDLILTGRRVDAAEALRIGLVNAVFPASELIAKALELAEQIAANSPLAVRTSKRLMAIVQGSGYEAGLAAEAAAFAAEFGSPDQIEGMTAFLEKRKPEFTGEHAT